jgi:hypothetical protein
VADILDTRSNARGGEFHKIEPSASDNGIMPSQVIVPHRPGPLAEAPEARFSEAGSDRDDRCLACDARGRTGIGTPEIVLSAGGAVLLAAVLSAGWPAWLSVVAVGCLALGLALPAHAALLRAKHRCRPAGMLLDVSDGVVCRLVTAYGRLERTAGPGLARDAAHLAVAEVAALLDGRPPEGGEQEAYVARRAEAVSALADRLADGPVIPVEIAAPDSLARIEALLAH